MAAKINIMSPILAMFGLALVVVVVADPYPLQDFCVADLNCVVKVNGYPCKDTSAVTPDDFYSATLAVPGATNAATAPVVVNGANVMKVPGVNTLGVSMGRIDYAVGGVNPPHTHPRASEVLYTLEGELEVGFVTTANVHVSKKLKKGDVFVFPRGLLHYQKNVGGVPAVAITAFDSQNPGTQSVVAALFGASPALPVDVLTGAFKVDARVVEDVKCKVASKV